MEAKKKKSHQGLNDDFYGDIPLSDADDKTLNRMKDILKKHFDAKNRGYVDSEDLALLTGVARGFTDILSEQRHRATIRAKQKQLRNKGQ